jgi:hypothetical protein
LTKHANPCFTNYNNNQDNSQNSDPDCADGSSAGGSFAGGSSVGGSITGDNSVSGNSAGATAASDDVAFASCDTFKISCDDEIHTQGTNVSDTSDDEADKDSDATTSYCLSVEEDENLEIYLKDPDDLDLDGTNRIGCKDDPFSTSFTSDLRDQDGPKVGAQDDTQNGTQDGAQDGAPDGIQDGAQVGTQHGTQDGTQAGAQDGTQVGIQDGASSLKGAPGLENGVKKGGSKSAEQGSKR